MIGYDIIIIQCNKYLIHLLYFYSKSLYILLKIYYFFARRLIAIIWLSADVNSFKNQNIPSSFHVYKIYTIPFAILFLLTTLSLFVLTLVISLYQVFTTPLSCCHQHQRPNCQMVKSFLHLRQRFLFCSAVRSCKQLMSRITKNVLYL